MDFPTLEFSKRERSRGTPDDETIERGAQLFREWGALRLLDVFEPPLIESITRQYNQRYRIQLAGTGKEDQRPWFSPKLSGIFSETAYHSNPFLFPFVRRAVGSDCVLGAFGSVVSFPGAPAQSIHRGSGSLYDDYALDVRLPTYALTALIPLVGANHDTGTTRVWPGSHLEPSFDRAQAMPSSNPEVPVGSALLLDSRTLHGDDPNRSLRVRPILYNAYHRSWYRDDGGHPHRPSIHVGAFELWRATPERRRLLRIPRERSFVERFEWRYRRAVAELKDRLRFAGRALRRSAP